MQICLGVEEAGHFNVGFNVFGRKKVQDRDEGSMYTF